MLRTTFAGQATRYIDFISKGAHRGSFVLFPGEGLSEVHLMAFCINPLDRGKGFGRKMLRDCIKFCRRAGFHFLSLDVDDSNAKAKHLYEVEGFRLKLREGMRLHRGVLRLI